MHRMSIFVLNTLVLGMFFADTITAESEKISDQKIRTDTQPDSVAANEKNNNSTLKDKKPEAAVAPKMTKTAQLSKANGLCETRMTEICQGNLCPTYCESKYGAWHHSGDMMQKECEARCKTDLCQVKTNPDAFDTPLDIQLREQLKICIKEIPDQKDPQGEDHKWFTFREEAFAKLEKNITEKHDGIEKNRLAKEKTAKEAENKKREEEEKEYARCWMSNKKNDASDMSNTVENTMNTSHKKEGNEYVTEAPMNNTVQSVVNNTKNTKHHHDISSIETGSKTHE